MNGVGLLCKFRHAPAAGTACVEPCCKLHLGCLSGSLETDSAFGAAMDETKAPTGFSVLSWGSHGTYVCPPGPRQPFCHDMQGAPPDTAQWRLSFLKKPSPPHLWPRHLPDPPFFVPRVVLSPGAPWRFKCHTIPLEPPLLSVDLRALLSFCKPEICRQH